MTLHKARIVSLVVSLCLLFGLSARALSAEDKKASAGAEDEAQALEKAFDSAAGNLQVLIRNLEEFLARFPQSTRREQVLRTILRQAQQANDPRTAATYAERLLELTPDDPSLLSTLVDLLDRQGDASSREKALQYATRLVARVEKIAAETKPEGVSEARWQETQALMRATAYLVRGKIFAKSGESARAFEDFERSYVAYPTAQLAERQADLAARVGQNERALDFYATAFAFPEKNAEPTWREQIRRKLGSLYIQTRGSEIGLGDLILARYDELVRSLGARLAGGERPNAEARDPFDYVLERLDGSPLRLADYRGKVVVMDFWATWCGPCRLEGRLLERVFEEFRSEPRVVFLAVNAEEERDGVPQFVKDEKWTLPVVYAQGLDRQLGVNALPTLIIFDREGRVVFRQAGIDPATFGETLAKKIGDALKEPSPTAMSSP